MLSLPNSHILLGSETGDGCIARVPTPHHPNMPLKGCSASLQPGVSSVLHNAAPVWSFVVANLQKLPQNQVSVIGKSHAMSATKDIATHTISGMLRPPNTQLQQQQVGVQMVILLVPGACECSMSGDVTSNIERVTTSSDGIYPSPNRIGSLAKLV